ncbi:MAG: hypothetical protein VKJ24_16500 [Synechococcales bacterium]|nr:hypothetical protein [Synechococcales bacterium]
MHSLNLHSLRDRAHHLINTLTDEELEVMWTVMQTHYYDLYMLGEIQSAKENFKPGDLLTHEGAIDLLKMLRSPQNTL